ncbi:carcinine hydrolase/isopenicillin-N N-acyltransferase family protein, partial [Dialister hominis]
LLPDLTQFNHKIGRSSSTRLHRIDELLSEPHAPYTLDDMIAFSEDEHDGPNDSIWRTGSRKDGVQTLATIGVWLHDDAKPDIYVKIRYSPDDQGKEDIYQLDGAHLFPSR